MNDALCPLTHKRDPERPRTAAPGARLCHGHLGQLADNLEQLPDLYAELAAYLTTPGASVPGGSLSTGITLNDAVVASRDHIKHTLTSWACIALEEGPWTQAPDDNPRAIARWLFGRMDWLVDQDWTAEFAGNIAETAGEARAQVQPDHPYLVELGPCPERVWDYDGDEGPVIVKCDGTVVAKMRRADSLLPSVVTCTSRGHDDEEEPHAWTPAQWHTLGRRMGLALNPDAAATFVKAFGAG